MVNLELKEKVLLMISTKRKGDMYVVSDVVIPEKLTRDQKKLLDELSNTDLANSSKFKKYNKYLSKQSVKLIFDAFFVVNIYVLTIAF